MPAASFFLCSPFPDFSVPPNPHSIPPSRNKPVITRFVTAHTPLKHPRPQRALKATTLWKTMDDIDTGKNTFSLQPREACDLDENEVEEIRDWLARERGRKKDDFVKHVVIGWERRKVLLEKGVGFKVGDIGTEAPVKKEEGSERKHERNSNASAPFLKKSVLSRISNTLLDSGKATKENVPQLLPRHRKITGTLQNSVENKGNQSLVQRRKALFAERRAKHLNTRGDHQYHQVDTSEPSSLRSALRDRLLSRYTTNGTMESDSVTGTNVSSVTIARALESTATLVPYTTANSNTFLSMSNSHQPLISKSDSRGNTPRPPKSAREALPPTALRTHTQILPKPRLRKPAVLSSRPSLNLNNLNLNLNPFAKRRIWAKESIRRFPIESEEDVTTPLLAPSVSENKPIGKKFETSRKGRKISLSEVLKENKSIGTKTIAVATTAEVIKVKTGTRVENIPKARGWFVFGAMRKGKKE